MGDEWDWLVLGLEDIRTGLNRVQLATQFFVKVTVLYLFIMDSLD